MADQKDRAVFDFGFWLEGDRAILCAVNESTDRFSYSTDSFGIRDLYAILGRSIYLLKAEPIHGGFRIEKELPWDDFSRFIPDLKIQAAGATRFTHKEFMVILDDVKAILRESEITSVPTHYSEWGYSGFLNRNPYSKSVSANGITLLQLLIDTFGKNRQWPNRRCERIELHFEDGGSVALGTSQAGGPIRIITPAPFGSFESFDSSTLNPHEKNVFDIILYCGFRAEVMEKLIKAPRVYDQAEILQPYYRHVDLKEGESFDVTKVIHALGCKIAGTEDEIMSDMFDLTHPKSDASRSRRYFVGVLS